MYPNGYILFMNQISKTAQFDKWLRGLKDHAGKIRIVARIRAATQGNFGNYKQLGSGLSEMKINTGPGYRVYYTQVGKKIYFLLSGGDKSSQRQDIQKARKMAEEIRKEYHD